MHVDILELQAPRHAALLIFGGDPVEAGQDEVGVFSADDAAVAQHRRMGARSGEVLAP
jgi:hypothetical protein